MRSLAASAACLVLGQATAHGQCLGHEQAKITAPDPAAHDELGHGVAISGDVVVLGAPQRDGGVSPGTALVYRFDGAGWNPEATLIASDGQGGDFFGWSVGIDGGVIVVGAPLHDICPVCDNGAAYVFRFDAAAGTWSEEDKLTPSDSLPGEEFGSVVAVSGDVVAIGEPLSQQAPYAGAVYVFRAPPTRTGVVEWIEEQRLTASGGASADRFGRSVSVSGDVIVAGAPFDDDEGNNAGSAYVFRFDGDGWIEEARLTASDVAAGDEFGGAVCVRGDLLLAGSPGEDFGGDANTGAAYLFAFAAQAGGGWGELAKLTASDPDFNAAFATSLSLGDGVVLVGSRWDDENGEASGSAYVYLRPEAGWADATETAKVTASDGDEDDRFAASLSVSGGKAVFGARFDDDGAGNAGAAYAVTGLADCNDNGLLDLCEVAAGSTPDDNGDGHPDACCPWDVDVSGAVGVNDFLDLLAAWGTDPGGPPDFDGDGDVGFADFLELIANWGPCA